MYDRDERERRKCTIGMKGREREVYDRDERGEKKVYDRDERERRKCMIGMKGREESVR